MKNAQESNNQEITVLELRNYLLKPDTAEEFKKYFNTHFVAPMHNLGGYTLGQFKSDGSNDRFVWFRGFKDMQTRVKFLNDFYVDSKTWKDFGKGANEMMINSDNVYLLRPLFESISANFLDTSHKIVEVNFYTCNSTLDKVIALFNTEYVPFLESIEIKNTTLWVSEMQENDFPRLPAFQDKNLLVSITSFENEKEHQLKQKLINEMSNQLKQSMQQLITTRNTLLLIQ
ncbi:MAG: NIPSNAP family protein [Flavobacterium sp.]|uniref:NIPSNAP family protein n=1 Tax=Flavobacterium sp. TaxID=239 RepID=UPI001B0D86C6|nr:NIPSNAP family protein [Flavobacterium sp.]MBO9584766.1 NIPSNAP family protein [Flavobacterium sp.]